MFTKVCTKCGTEKEATEEFFHKSKRGLYGLRADCKDCKNAQKAEYYKLHAERQRQITKENYLKNRDKRIEYAKQYRKENETARKAYAKKYYAENREVVLQRYKDWASKSKYKLREYQVRTKEHRREVTNKFNSNNKEIVCIRSQKRRAIKMSLEHNLSLDTWIKIKADFNCKCAYCGKEGKLEQEHFVPLVKGGEYTLNNIIPACSFCNRSKGSKDFFDWYPKQDFYSKEREQKILEHLNYNKNNTQKLSIS